MYQTSRMKSFVLNIVWIPIGIAAGFGYLAMRLSDYEDLIFWSGLLVLIAYYLHALWTAIWFKEFRYAIEDWFEAKFEK